MEAFDTNVLPSLTRLIQAGEDEAEIRCMYQQLLDWCLEQKCTPQILAQNMERVEQKYVNTTDNLHHASLALALASAESIAQRNITEFNDEWKNLIWKIISFSKKFSRNPLVSFIKPSQNLKAWILNTMDSEDDSLDPYVCLAMINLVDIFKINEMKSLSHTQFISKILKTCSHLRYLVPKEDKHDVIKIIISMFDHFHTDVLNNKELELIKMDVGSTEIQAITCILELSGRLAMYVTKFIREADSDDECINETSSLLERVSLSLALLRQFSIMLFSNLCQHERIIYYTSSALVYIIEAVVLIGEHYSSSKSIGDIIEFNRIIQELDETLLYFSFPKTSGTISVLEHAKQNLFPYMIHFEKQINELSLPLTNFPNYNCQQQNHQSGSNRTHQIRKVNTHDQSLTNPKRFRM